MDNVPKYQCRTEAFKSSFFPWTITKWNSLDLQTRNLSYTAFRKPFIDKFRQVPNSLFNIRNPVGIKLLTRLRLGSSHLNEHRFNHIFINFRIAHIQSVFVVLRMSQQLISSCTVIFTFL